MDHMDDLMQLGNLKAALGIESDDVVNYCFPKDWPDDRKQRALYIGEWLKTEARYLAS
jgi:hypothetical protein